MKKETRKYDMVLVGVFFAQMLIQQVKRKHGAKKDHLNGAFFMFASIPALSFPIFGVCNDERERAPFFDLSYLFNWPPF